MIDVYDRPAYKVFGFFDRMRVEAVEPVGPAVPTPEGNERHQRILFGFGDRRRVEAILARDEGTSYLVVSLIKLAGDDAHQNYYKFLDELIAHSNEKTVYLGCLDAPDVIVLARFGEDPATPHAAPMARLITWVEGLGRGSNAFAGKLERSLTMVATKSLPIFIKELAKLDDTATASPARALVRITDMRDGYGLARFRHQARHIPAVERQLFASVGYYDLQGVVTLPDAAAILGVLEAINGEELRNGRTRVLSSSTCLLSEKAPLAVGAEEPPLPPKPVMPLVESMKAEWRLLKAELKPEGTAPRWKNVPPVYDLVQETVRKFVRLFDSGLIPGSRLLVWTCRDAIKGLREECAEHHEASRGETGEVWLDRESDFHLRQYEYGLFFRAICDELDRRVSLSLSAHTRVYPSAIQAPLKVVGALDMAGRVVAASFRCFPCRRRCGLLQVFTTNAEIPTQFFPFRRDGQLAGPVRRPYPTMVVTTFSPAMVQHFHLALLIVMHEVAQCIIHEATRTESFSALLFSQAYVERVATITMLARAEDDEGRHGRVTESIWKWARAFLAEELRVESTLNEPEEPLRTRRGPGYFLIPDTDGGLVGVEPKLLQKWRGENFWQTQVGQWRVHPVDGQSPSALQEINLLFRDALFCGDIEEKFAEESFGWRWAQELHAHLGLGATVPTPAEPGAGVTRPLADRKKQYQETISKRCQPALNVWSEACEVNEYMELASLVPFMRLFEQPDQADAEAVAKVIVALVKDYGEVYNGFESVKDTYNVARRFLVVLASIRVRHAHVKQQAPLDDAMGEKSQALLDREVIEAARSLYRESRNLPAGRARSACRALWYRAANFDPSDPQTTPLTEPGPLVGNKFDVRAVHPLILAGLVRFTTRMMYVFDTEGVHIPEDAGRNTKASLRSFNSILREMFLQPRQGPIAAERVALFWSVLYKLTENPEIDFLFDLQKAVTAIGEVELPGPAEDD